MLIKTTLRTNKVGLYAPTYLTSGMMGLCKRDSEMEIVKSLQLIMDRDGFCPCFIKHASKDHPQEIVAVVDVGRWFHKQVETRYMCIYI